MRIRPVIVVLAAGRLDGIGGQRHLLMQPFAGATVIGATVRNAVQTQLPVVVVTRAEMVGTLAQQLATRDIVVLDDALADKGVGHAISAGVAERSGATGWLLLPANMPLVKPGSLLAVASALENQAVVTAEYQGRRGYPVGFSAELYSELVMLSADDDASRLLARYPAHILDLADRGVILRAERPEELTLMRQLAAKGL